MENIVSIHAAKKQMYLKEVYVALIISIPTAISVTKLSIDDYRFGSFSKPT